jgi:AraC family transcriptional regulator, regulatory protein of adaptative response / DNA-3-methyladenine glycosylase II
MLKFLAERTVREAEFVTGGTYSRTLRRGNHTGWIKVSKRQKKCPQV